MYEYKIKTTVDVHDVDHNGVARASSVLKYMQTAAQSQLTANGMSYDSLYQRQRAFILSRIKLEVLKPLRADTPLTALTFPCDSRGFSFLRCYALEQDGETVAKAASLWALIDTETHGLVKVNDFELGLPTLPPHDVMLGRMKLPSRLAEVGEYTVHYGEIDRNRHMNNTKYPDIYSTFLSLDRKMIRSLSINYLNEARMGERLRVLGAEADGVYYFRTQREDGKVNSAAEIELMDI